MSGFDWYTLRAQVFPGVISTAPALALAAMLVTWDSFHLSQVVAPLALTVLLFAFAVFTRQQGLRVQPKLFPDGLPTTQRLRHRDHKYPPEFKSRVLAFICGKINRTPPTADHERLNKGEADRMYEECVGWLRNNTRKPEFKLLLHENMNYGFFRNLYGMKTIGLAIGALTVLGVAVFAGYNYGKSPAHDLTPLFLIVFVALVHAAFLLVVITKPAVKQAADAYARELFLAAETLMGQAAPARSDGRT
jgi:hypothetical protein